MKKIIVFIGLLMSQAAYADQQSDLDRINEQAARLTEQAERMNDRVNHEIERMRDRLENRGW